MLKAGLGVAETYTAGQETIGAFINDAFLVPDLQFQALIGYARRNLNLVFAFVLSDAVTDGVFDEWLQQKGRDLLIERGRICANFKCKSVSETLTLNANVEIEKLEFACERDFVCPHLVERDAEKLTKSQKHIFGRARVILHESNCGLKSIEKKMRLKLHAQRLELGRSQACFELSLVKLALTDLFAQMDKGRDHDDDPVGKDAHQSPLLKRFENKFNGRGGPFESGRVNPSRYSAKYALYADTNDACNRVRHKNALRPVRSSDGVLTRESQNEGAKKRPRIPVERCPGEIVVERQNVTTGRVANKDLSALENHDSEPAGDRERQLLEISGSRQLLGKPCFAGRDGWSRLHWSLPPASL